jgi:hypothetical protein
VFSFAVLASSVAAPTAVLKLPALSLKVKPNQQRC